MSSAKCCSFRLGLNVHIPFTMGRRHFAKHSKKAPASVAIMDSLQTHGARPIILSPQNSSWPSLMSIADD